MLQLDNQTPFAAQLALFPDARGIDTLYVIVKATLNMGRQWALHEEQLEPVAADEYWSDDPAQSSIKFASDFHLGKPSTDILVTGKALPPDLNPVRQMDVAVQVGATKKDLRVFGDRFWDNGRISAPASFEKMPLVYERAFGGVHAEDDEIIAGEMRNPVGCGFVGERKPEAMHHWPVPNLEDPRLLLQKFGDVVAPACFGCVAPAWEPRLQYAGTYDEAWQKNKAPFLPKDFDQKFFNMAHPDLIYSGYLQGGEPVRIEGMHAKGPMQFNLPTIGLEAKVKVEKATEAVKFDLETLLLEPNDLRAQFVWKAAFPCDKKALKVSEVSIAMNNMAGLEVA